MNSVNKNVVIALVVVGLLLAVFSFKTYFLDSGSTSGVRAQVTKQLQAQPSTNGTADTQPVPSTAGIHMPGNKH